MLVGAFSVNAYSVPRSTNAADVVIDYHSGDLAKIRQSLSSDFVVDSQLTVELHTGSRRNILTHRPTLFDIELFHLGGDPHDQTRFKRRRQLLLPDLQIEAVIPTPEDVLIQKLRWQRDKDLADARLLIDVQGERLNWEYIYHWAEQHDTADLLKRLRSKTRDRG